MCNLQLICQFIYQLSIKYEDSYLSISKNGKFGWYNTLLNHVKNYVTRSTSSTNAKLVLVGDSIIENFEKCGDIFDIFFLPFRNLNFGISGDKIQDVSRRVCNMTLPAPAEYVIIFCGTNNLGHNSPLKIAEGLIKIVCISKKITRTFIFSLAAFYQEIMKKR